MRGLRADLAQGAALGEEASLVHRYETDGLMKAYGSQMMGLTQVMLDLKQSFRESVSFIIGKHRRPCVCELALKPLGID
jgi:hypothetical protein